MKRTSRSSWLALAVLPALLAASFGGFALRVEKPAATSEALLVVRTFGCAHPENARVTGTAEGFVDGQRRSVPLRFERQATGVYAVERHWPAEGRWVLAITGAYQGMTSSVLVTPGSDGSLSVRKDAQVQTIHGSLSAAQIEHALQVTTAGQTW